MPKRITNAQILGEQGVALIKSRLLKMGFTWHPTNQALEAGIDGLTELRDTRTGEVGNCWLAVQSKARSSFPAETDATVCYDCTREEVGYWLKGNEPVILVVSRPATDEAWWVSVKDHFRNSANPAVLRITFNKTRDSFDEHAADELKALGSRYGSGAYFTPPPRRERLMSNLLRVVSWPSAIFHATTPYRDPKDLYAKLKEHVEWPPREWALTSGRLYSYHDLRCEPWPQVVVADSTCTVPTKEWAFSEEEEKRRDFVRLMNQCLRELVGRWGMVYSKEQGCYYFKPTADLGPRTLRYKSKKRQSTRTVFSAHMAKRDPSRVAYYRHAGFQPRFRCLDGTWYLEITPTYVFTKDGKEPDAYSEERLSGIKLFEGDAAVAGSVLMFADMLRDKPDLFRQHYGLIGFGELEDTEIGVGIDDAAWSLIKAKDRQEMQGIPESGPIEPPDEAWFET